MDLLSVLLFIRITIYAIASYVAILRRSYEVSFLALTAMGIAISGNLKEPVIASILGNVASLLIMLVAYNYGRDKNA